MSLHPHCPLPPSLRAGDQLVTRPAPSPGSEVRSWTSLPHSRWLLSLSTPRSYLLGLSTSNRIRSKYKTMLVFALAFRASGHIPLSATSGEGTEAGPQREHQRKQPPVSLGGADHSVAKRWLSRGCWAGNTWWILPTARKGISEPRFKGHVRPAPTAGLREMRGEA